ncbi:ArsO family NAD(P)H-dependent flavin-containing monooxygenase [Nesterenkonia sp. AY15]|uniref:ArsO family NAD(P)H-dependent flavin-containing monooxygenase n=1 Tax=Nesterenkonia sp. AY15 TaxID=2901139 RepID=UPI001F4CA91D|nr:ArsO family NAD(P)H-dependent flavin-containing monooxygenase [Nesterenkonia sp. AY15]
MTEQPDPAQGPTPQPPAHVQVAIVGGGQAGLATGFYLRRAGLTPGEDFVIIDAADRPGGAWPRMWDGLRIFSPSSSSSLPGWMMPTWDESAHGYPPRSHVVDYLTRYEQRYELNVCRPHRVTAVKTEDQDPQGRMLLTGDDLSLSAQTVISTTGTWERPFWPVYPGMRDFSGKQLHAADYKNPEEFEGRRVIIVGGGNSAAQILAEVSTVAETTWASSRPPRFLPDDVDGRALFAAATARIRALEEGREHAGVAGLGDIVMIPSVREARDRGALTAHPMFTRLTSTGVAWENDDTQDADVIIWCTGFRPALHHLQPLGLRDAHGHIRVGGPSKTQVLADPRLYLLGYGDWTGTASATLVGVGPFAKATAMAVADT